MIKLPDNRIFYVHKRHFEFRPTTDKDGIQSWNNDIAPRGGITFAIQDNGDDWKIGVARCSPKDNFVKSYGRIKALGKLNSKKQYILINKLGCSTLKDVIKKLSEMYKYDTAIKSAPIL